jgi:hypothetical protein
MAHGFITALSGSQNKPPALPEVDDFNRACGDLNASLTPPFSLNKRVFITILLTGVSIAIIINLL